MSQANDISASGLRVPSTDHTLARTNTEVAAIEEGLLDTRCPPHTDTVVIEPPKASSNNLRESRVRPQGKKLRRVKAFTNRKPEEDAQLVIDPSHNKLVPPQTLKETADGSTSADGSTESGDTSVSVDKEGEAE